MARGFTAEQLDARRARERAQEQKKAEATLRGHYKDIRTEAAQLARIAGYNNASVAELRKLLRSVEGAVDRLERFRSRH